MIVAFTTCKKEAVRPPLMDMLGHKVYSATELKAIATCTNNCAKTFSGEVYFIGVVVADQQGGNFYKELYVRDRYNTGAIHLDLVQAANIWVGDSVRVNLRGLNIGVNPDTDILEIDSLDWEKHVVPFAKGATPQPRVLSIQQFTSNLGTYLGDLIKITDVTFTSADKGQTWADAVAGKSLNRILQDCIGNQLIVRTSNYAKFAYAKTPTGAGTIMGIGTSYKGDAQMELRNVAEVQMTGVGCQVYLKKDFNNDSIIGATASQDWKVVSVTNPSVMWVPSTFGADKFAKINGFISGPGNTNSECWLISPSIDLSAANDPVLSFRTAANFNGTVLKVKVSTNYTSGAPSSATWTNLTVALSSTGYSWTPSGNISLNAYKSSNTRIAYSYTSTTSGSKVYEVDDVLVKEN